MVNQSTIIAGVNSAGLARAVRVSNAGDLAVSGPVTDAELRASRVSGLLV